MQLNKAQNRKTLSNVEIAPKSIRPRIFVREQVRGLFPVHHSTELPEVLALSDRIIVMFEGQIMRELNGENADIDLIGELMLGHREAAEMAAGGPV